MPRGSHPGLSLRLNVSWTLAGNVVYAGCQWLMLVALARLGTAEMVGQFALAMALTAPIFMLTNLNLRAVQATDARLDFSFPEYFGLRLLTTSAALAAVGVLSLWGGYRRETALIVAAIGVAKAFEAISDILYGVFQHHERMDRIAVSMMIKGPLSLAAMAIALTVTGSVFVASITLAGVWAAVLAAYDVPRAVRILRSESGDRLRPAWDLPRLTTLARIAFPLGCVTMLISLNSNVPRYFIERTLGEGPLGIFAALASLMIAGGVVVNALGQSASPRLSRYAADGDATAYRSLMTRLYGLSLALGGAGILAAVAAGPRILTALFGSEYARHSGVLIWLMAAAALSFIFSMLGTSLTALRCFRIQAVLHTMSAAVSIPLFFYLTRAQGLMGTSRALFIQALMMMLVYGWAEARARTAAAVGQTVRAGEVPAA